MLYAQPLHVQHSAVPLLADAETIACGSNLSPVREERAVWDYCVVSNKLGIRFLQFRDGADADKGKDAPAGSTFFILNCINGEDVLRENSEKKGVLTAVRRESCVSCWTANPHVAGSQSAHATDLLARYHRASPLSTATALEQQNGAAGSGDAAVGMQRLAAERAGSKFVKESRRWLDYLSLALSLPTVAVLVHYEGQERTVLLVLRPHVHAGKSASIGYHATVVPTSSIARRVAVTGCGRRVLVLPERFATVEDPLRACEASAPVVSGEVVEMVNSGCVGPTPFHVLAGEAAAGSRKGQQQVERVRGTPITWVQCRQGIHCSNMEVVLLSQRGLGLVCVAGSVPGTSVCGLRFRCIRCFVGAARSTLGADANAMIWGSDNRWVPALTGTSSEAVAVVGERSRGSAVRLHVPRQRVVGRSRDGLVLLCVPVSAPTEVTVVLATPRPTAGALGQLPCTAHLPEWFDLQDVHVVLQPHFSGALLGGLNRTADARSSLRGGRSCPLELRFLPFGSSETCGVSVVSLRQWKTLPEDFFAPSHRMRFLSVEVVEDPSGTPTLLVVLGSTGGVKAVATLLVGFPSSTMCLQGCRRGEGGAGLSVLVESHVAQTVAALRLQSEWSQRQRRSDAVAPWMCLAPCGVGTAPTVAEQALLDDMVELTPTTSCGEGRRGPATGAADDALCELEDGCVEALRLELLETQRDGGDVTRCVADVSQLFVGIQCGVAVASAVPDVVVEHMEYFRTLSRVLISGMEVLQLSGAASAMHAAASVLLSSGGENVGPWQRLLRPVIEMAFTSTCGAAVMASSLLAGCGTVMRCAAAAGREWLQAEEERRTLSIGGTNYPLRTLRENAMKARPLEEVASALAAGPGSWEALSIVDIYWAARRLFLSSGPTAAVRLLQPLVSSPTCAQSTRQLHDMYREMDRKTSSRVAQLCIPDPL